MNARLFSAVSILAVLTLAACAHKPKADSDSAAANANGMSQVSDKAIASDAAGSDSGKIQGLSSVHFEYDKATLTPETRRILSEDAKWMTDHPNQALLIEGHCDRHGSTEYNLALGERRAKSVRSYLVDLGVPANRVSTISYGSEKLLDDAETAEADAKNRRANFVPTASVNQKAMN